MAKVNCAVYVRKSTEKGLELEFNSLHNQEESCKAYIASQAFNEWVHYKTYTDGGISGGTMERAGLKQMLDDISKGLVQTVVVYKVDRLSRSIMDFHNMMKDLEKYNCNFVSITQSFDTSTSMGKLTLNMLLSFAQFEREVSSERVRDKIYASKSKGFWMGGTPRLGYDIVEKKLVVNESEAEIVNLIYKMYLEAGSILEVARYLKEQGVLNKKWVNKEGIEKGGSAFMSSAVHRILKDRLYLGEIENKATNESFKGLHKAIIDKELFDEVQAKLSGNNSGRENWTISPNLLTGKLFDENGVLFTNQVTCKNGKVAKRYYSIKGLYLPSDQVDKLVKDTVNEALNLDIDKIGLVLKRINPRGMDYFKHRDFIKIFVKKAIYAKDKMTFFLNLDEELLKGFVDESYINQESQNAECLIDRTNNQIIIEKDIVFSKGLRSNRYNAGKSGLMTITENQQSIVRAFAYAWKFRQMYEEFGDVKEIVKSQKMTQRTVYKYLNLAYISPKILNEIMNSEKNYNIQDLFILTSKYENFQDQEIY